MCVCVCVVIPFILDVRHHVDTSAGVTEGERHTGFLHLPSAVLALFFIPGRIQPSISLVYREAEFCVPTINGIIYNSLFGVYCKKNRQAVC